MTQSSPNREWKVYIVENAINGKVYVGKTSYGYNKRWAGHRSLATRGLGYHFQNAIAKYGAGSFNLITLIPLKNGEDAALVEILLIEIWKSNRREFGYNLTDGGEGTVGHRHSESTKLKLRIARRKRLITQQTRARMSAAKRGQKLTAAHVAHISASKLGVKRGPQPHEWQVKRLLTMTGFKHSTEAKRNMSAIKKVWWSVHKSKKAN